MKTTAAGIAPLGRLLWKEYRTVRGFWLALVALVVLIQLITITFSQDSRDSMGLVYNFALGAPAFFAIGCAGAAFAMEQEEGTFEFLRAGPANSRQVFISKLALAFCATLAMFSLLLPIAVWFMRGQLPEASTFSGMLGLWLVAALEAIAWGTLFSLLTARPLLAICLGIAATSTIAHLLAWTKATGPIGEISYGPYLQVVPYRMLVVGLVFIVDVCLGMSWLNTAGEAVRKRKSTRTGRKDSTPTTAGYATAKPPASKPDRSAMLGHLFWQHGRQSWPLMAVVLGLVPVALFAARMIGTTGRFAILGPIPMAVLASIAGSFVFLADQERQRYRFFVEHNVPARYVWFTRLTLWLVVATLATLLFVWFSISNDEWRAWKDVIRSMTNPWYREEHAYSWRPFFDLDPLVIAIGFAAVSFAAGQWASMFVRSGLMAAFVGLLLSAVLSGWVMLIHTMRVGFWWTVAPTCAVLLFATWLRAPNWIRERSKWNLWLRDAAVLLIPAIVLIGALASYRVDQIPLVNPGFDPNAYLAEVTPEALATGELYRRALDSYVFYSAESKNQEADRVPGYFRGGSRALNDNDIAWLNDNSKTLELILEAAKQPTCVLQNPKSINQWPPQNEGRLVDLVVASGR